MSTNKLPRRWTTAQIRACDLRPGDVFTVSLQWREVLDVYAEPGDFNPTGWGDERAAFVDNYVNEYATHVVVRYLDEEATLREDELTDGIEAIRRIDLVTVQIPVQIPPTEATSTEESNA